MKSMFCDDCARGLALGALPLLALTGAGLEALAGGLGITLILVLTVILARAGRAVLPGGGPGVAVLAGATAAASVGIAAVVALPAVAGTLGLYLPVMALSALVLAAATGEDGAAWTPAGALGRGLGLTALMLVVGLVRELLGRGEIFGTTVLAEAPLYLAAQAPGALIIVGSVLGLIQWAASCRAGGGAVPADGGTPGEAGR